MSKNTKSLLTLFLSSLIAVLLVLVPHSASAAGVDNGAPLKATINSALQSGHLNENLGNQLLYRVGIIDQLEKQKQKETAVSYLKDLKTYAGSETLLAQKLITKDVQTKISQQADTWSNYLSGNQGGQLIQPNTQESRVYDWLSQMQLKNGLIESKEDGNQVSLYDNALSAIIFTANGDYAKAEKIFDFFNSRLATEFDGKYKGFAQFRDRDGKPENNKPNRWLGDNAWLLIALDNYQAKTNSNKYQKLTSKLETWIHSLQDNDGGLWGGTDPDDQRIDKNTEGILDAFVAVKGYDNFHRNILKYLQNNRYNTQTNLLKAAEGKYMYPLDLISWGYGMLEGYPNNALLKAGIMFNSQKPTANPKNEVFGYSFDVDNDTIWVEGTGEMAVSFNIAGMKNEANFTIQQMEKMFIQSDKFKGAQGLPYATNPGTGYGTGSLWDGVDTNIAVSSSVWYILAKTHYNPYNYASGRSKGIPQADQFYAR